MSRGGDVSAAFLDYLRSLTEVLSVSAAEVKLRLPRAGESDISVSEYMKTFRGALQAEEKKLSDWLAHENVLADLHESTKWKILGFEDEESFEDYVYPRLAQLLRRNDARIRDLARRLLTDPTFTPAGLASEGHRKSIVMDVVNALVREDAAIWTDLTESGSKGKGLVTSTGRELLTKLMADSTRSA
jgi:hypothetical protein